LLKVGTVQPAVARHGSKVTVKLTLDANRVPPEFVQPEAVRIGKYAARTIHWDGATVTAEFVLPAGAAVGPQTVTVVFPGPPGTDWKVTFTREKGFTVR
jgi:hypothetical protein